MEAYLAVAEAHASGGGDDDVLVMCDAYDVACTARQDGSAPAALLAAWRTYGVPLVFSAERLCPPTNCRPLTEWWTASNERGGDAAAAAAASPYKYVNGGFVMGTARALRDFYSWALAQGYQDDQLAAAAYMNTFGPAVVAIDALRRLVWTQFSSDEEPPPVPAAPFFKHCPGVLPSTQAILEAAYAQHCGVRGMYVDAKPSAQYDSMLWMGAGVLALVLLLVLGVGVALGRRGERRRRNAAAAAYDGAGAQARLAAVSSAAAAAAAVPSVLLEDGGSGGGGGAATPFSPYDRRQHVRVHARTPVVQLHAAARRTPRHGTPRHGTPRHGTPWAGGGGASGGATPR